MDDKNDINRDRSALISQINNVLCFFGKLDCVTKMRLLISYCYSLYGCVILILDCTPLHMFDCTPLKTNDMITLPAVHPTNGQTEHIGFCISTHNHAVIGLEARLLLDL